MSNKNIYSEVIDMENAFAFQIEKVGELKEEILSLLTSTKISGIFAVETLAMFSNDSYRSEDSNMKNKELYVYQKEIRVNGQWYKRDVIQIDPEIERLPEVDDNTRYVLVDKLLSGGR